MIFSIKKILFQSEIRRETAILVVLLGSETGLVIWALKMAKKSPIAMIFNFLRPNLVGYLQII